MSDRPMTDYERGRADGLREAAEAVYRTENWLEAEKKILSLIPEGADQREAQQVSNNPPNATADPQSASHQNPGEQEQDASGRTSVGSSPIPARPGPFVMVPREPTEEMIAAMHKADRDFSNNCFHGQGHLSRAEFVYRAMLHAAQEEK